MAENPSQAQAAGGPGEKEAAGSKDAAQQFGALAEDALSEIEAAAAANPGKETPEEEAERLMAAALGGDPEAAKAVEDAAAAAMSGGGGSAKPGKEESIEGRNMDLPNFQQVLADVQSSGIDLLRDVDLHVKIELGRTHMMVEDVLKLGEGSVVELNKLAGDPVDVYVNDRLVARGEVLVLNDNFCVRVSEVISNIEEEVGEDVAVEEQKNA